jgi:hypothetical protein
VSERSQGEGTARPQAGVPPAFRQRRSATSPPGRVIQFPDAAAQERGFGRPGRCSRYPPPPRSGCLRARRTRADRPPPNPAQAERLPHSGTRLMPWPLPHRRSPAPVAIRRVASALMAMEALVQPRHIKVSRRFYVAQSFDPAMGDVLAGPVPDVALDPADRVVGRTASPPVLQRLTRGQYELLPGDQEYPWPTAGGGG